jgi:hypothetical protein
VSGDHRYTDIAQSHFEGAEAAHLLTSSNLPGLGLSLDLERLGRAACAAHAFA